MPDRPTPAELWRQAGGGTPTYSRDRYRELLREHGHLVPLAPGETATPLPCGWPHPLNSPPPAERPPGYLGKWPPVCGVCGHRHAGLPCADHTWRDSCPYDAGADCDNRQEGG